MQNVGKVRALMMVAHPDDCVIFGYPFYSTHKQFDWSVCYLTYNNWDWRAQELTKFWNSRAVKTHYLGFTDDYLQVEAGELGFNHNIAEQKIIEFANDFNLIMTHNADGDYGHIHHKFVHSVVTKINCPQLYFAGIENFNYQCMCQENEYNLDDLPRHKDVIKGFTDRHIGRYLVPDKARDLI